MNYKESLFVRLAAVRCPNARPCDAHHHRISITCTYFLARRSTNSVCEKSLAQTAPKSWPDNGAESVPLFLALYATRAPTESSEATSPQDVLSTARTELGTLSVMRRRCALDAENFAKPSFKLASLVNCNLLSPMGAELSSRPIVAK